jgi:uncharacterized protein (TIGR03083 family)
VAQLSPALDKGQYVDTIGVNSALLADAARLGLEAPVPTCPGWYAATLVAHLGEVQRFWAYQIRTRAQEPQELPPSAFDSCPGLMTWYQEAIEGRPNLATIPAGLVEWLERGTAELVTAFRAVDPEEPIWHWSGDNRAITHMRNQAMEATVHRWDAQNAQGMTTPVDSVIALDGIDQHFEVQIPAARRWGKPIQGGGETYHFHRTDGEGEWLVRFEGDDVTVSREHAKGDVAVRGSAEDLFLWLWGRIPSDRLEVHGDASLLERYRELVPSS